ncbi:SusC/RagA family TonB-linked outer membrane protein [Chitinophaga japonensis]|uniref:Iron complex outermembrane receptor protein n=1 Tax=Chitinophaga japonensis TaxID=104662 RepID=A0A562STG9_CHIJA|nr:TonB-dependent receptor [Chitinophaga japonensis]TWI84545.1 iron complex outermembrane receptor protein [Chitinophaga japonensis]
MQKLRLIRFVWLLCFMACSLVTYAQTGSISGKIMDETGQPLPGATVFIKGTNQHAIAGPDGSFKLQPVSNGAAAIVIRMIGYQPIEREVTVNGELQQDFQLTADTHGLNEVVVVGYGTQKKSDLTGSITAVSSKDFNKGVVATPEQLITGKVAGVQIVANGGAPGSASKIRIRGGSSLNASNDPLIVIDGVPLDNAEVKGSSNPLSFINPNDIESFNILKDASATAIYGSRASNGVIIITTKKGKAGDKLRINFSTLHSLSQKEGIVPVLSAGEFRQLVNETGSDEQKQLLGNANTNWQDEIYRTAYSTDNNLSISGAIRSLPFRLSLGYMNQDGIVKTSSMRRTSAGLSLSPRLLNDHLKIDVNVRGAITNSRFADLEAINAAVAFDPTQPVHVNNQFGNYFEWIDPTSATGAPYTLATRNPLSMLELKNDKGEVKRSLGNIQFDYKFHFLPELRANLNLGYDVSESEGRTLVPAYAGNAYNRGGIDKSYSQTKNNKLLDFYLNYAKDLKGIHSRIDVTGGYSYQDFIRTEPAYPDLNAKGDTISAAGVPFKTQNTLVSFFGRVNYTLLDRYLLTATVRRDGSSRFREHWSTFPSVALAWRINQESFLKNAKVLSDLKLRVGYGVTGQQDFGGLLTDYPYLPRYTIGDPTAQYQFGSSYYLTLRPEGYDANIKWEETETYNAGLDFGFLNNRVSGSIDYYVKKTKDLLSVIPVAAGSNLTNQLLTNVGNIETKGLELTLNATPVSTRNFNWDAGLNFTYNTVEITNLTKVKDPNAQGIPVGTIAGGTGNTIQIHSVGYAPFSYFVYKQVYKDGKPVEGEYEDLNKDGQITPDDRYRYKSPNPKFLLGFNSQFSYKNWNAGFSLRGSIGNYVYNNASSNNGAYRNFSYPNYLANVSPSVLETNFAVNQYFSDYYVENASFLRMDNFTLGYSFKNILKDKASLRVSATVQNAFVITGYSGLDPELGIGDGIDNKFYPRPRVYSLGLNLDF